MAVSREEKNIVDPVSKATVVDPVSKTTVKTVPTKSVSRKGKIIIGSVIVLLLLVIVIVSIFATRKDVPEVTVVKIEAKRELQSTVTASGEIRPIQFINLTSEVQGRIEQIYVKEGDMVTKGQELVRLDPNQFESSTDAQIASLQAAQNETQVSQSQVVAAQNQLSQQQQSLNASQASVDTAQQAVATARQGVVASQTEVDQAQVNLDIANRELKRSADLVEQGVISKQEYDQNKDKVTTALVALRTAQSRLKSQQLAVNEAQSRVNEAKARASQQQVAVKDARRGVDTANLSADASNRRAQQQQAILRGQKSRRDKTLQVAPINGIIADIPSKVGTFAVAGLSTTPLLTIADMSTVNIEVKVDETQIDNVEVGQPVKIKVDALGDQEVTGEVRQKTPLAVGKSQTTGGLSTNINTNEAKEFRVVIQLTNLSEESRSSLRPGMSATAVITTKTVQNVLTVPLQSVITKKPDATPVPTIQNDTPASAPADKPKVIKGVYVLDGTKAKFVEVSTGIIGDTDIQITSGLSENQEVITGPSRILNTIKDDAVVKKQTKKDADAAANKS